MAFLEFSLSTRKTLKMDLKVENMRRRTTTVEPKGHEACHNSRGKRDLFLAHVSLYSTLKLSPICKNFSPVPLRRWFTQTRNWDDDEELTGKVGLLLVSLKVLLAFVIH